MNHLNYIYRQINLKYMKHLNLNLNYINNLKYFNPKIYQASNPQTYQQSPLKIYKPPQNQNQTPYINPSITNSMYQSDSNQSSNLMINPNDYIGNYNDLNAPNKRRLIYQLIFGIILFSNIGAFIDYLLYNFSIDNIMNF